MWKYSARTEATASAWKFLFDEYVGKKKDGSLNSQWSKKPATMIRKVAAVQALGEAFPQSFAGMYVAEEMGAEPEYAAGDVIDPQTQPAIEEKADVQQPVSSMPQPQMDAADDFFQLESMIEGR